MTTTLLTTGETLSFINTTDFNKQPSSSLSAIKVLRKTNVLIKKGVGHTIHHPFLTTLVCSL